MFDKLFELFFIRLNDDFSNYFLFKGAWATFVVSSFTSKLMSSKSITSAKTSNTINSSSTTSLASNSSSTDHRDNENVMIKKQMSNLNAQSKSSSNHSLKLNDRNQSSKQQINKETKESDQSDYDDASNDGWKDDLNKETSNKISSSFKSTKTEMNFDKNDKSDCWDVDEDIFDEEKDKKIHQSNTFSKQFNSDGLFTNDKKEKNLTNTGDWSSTTSKSINNRTMNRATIKTATNKSKTLEDELFESLAEPVTRKKRTGAMRLGAKKA